MGTTAYTITAAIAELRASISALSSIISTRFGSVAFTQKSIAAGTTVSFVVPQGYAGVLFLGAASRSDTIKGIYMISYSSGSSAEISVTTVKEASDAAIYESNGILRVKNKFTGATMRATLMTIFGTQPT
jgi:hypothetical protein